MYIDWVTWSIWSLGFIILVLWTVIPLKEFFKLKKDREKDD